jgi:hypothetical protein
VPLPLPLGVAPDNVDSGTGNRAVHNVLNPERQKFANAKPGASAEDDQSPVAPSVATFQVAQGCSKLCWGQGWASNHVL